MSFWTGTAKIHELYTAACGLYVCWLTIRAVTVLVAWMPQGRRVIFQKVKEWSLMVSLEKKCYWIIKILANGTCFIFGLLALLCILHFAFQTVLKLLQFTFPLHRLAIFGSQSVWICLYVYMFKYIYVCIFLFSFKSEYIALLYHVLFVLKDFYIFT